MFRWLHAFLRRELVSDVPPEMSLCLDCGKFVCSEGEFRDCAQRKERAAEIALDLQAAKEGETPGAPPSGAVAQDRTASRT